MSGVSTIETDQRFSGREDFWIIVAARSEDETEIRAGKAAAPLCSGATIANDPLFVPLVPFQYFLRFTEKVLLDMRVNKN